MAPHYVFRLGGHDFGDFSKRSSCAEVDLTNPVIYAIFRPRFHRSSEYL